MAQRHMESSSFQPTPRTDVRRHPERARYDRQTVYQVIDEAEEKLLALRATVEHVVPGRWDDVRPPEPSELQATTVVALPLEEASAKVRTGPPRDRKDDYDLAVWAGVIPLALTALPPSPD